MINMKNDFTLKRLSVEMGQSEYEMFQDIPAREVGSRNLCFGVPFENFRAYIRSQLAREFNRISEYDTPTIIFVGYANNKPVGIVGIRTKINNYWKNFGGNIFYVIRKSERNKGYGTTMLKMAVKECEKLGIKTVYAQCGANNIASYKIMEKNNFELIKVDKSRYYKKELTKINKKIKE